MKIQKNIKNIIFDLGGVILNIDYNKSAEAFKKLGLKNFDKLYSQSKQNHIFDNLEIGKLSANGFRNYIRKNVAHLTLSDQSIDSAWNAMLLDLPKERIQLLQSINNDYRIFLLSNTNEIHVKKFTDYINKTFSPNLFQELFEQYYYSNEIGMRKPNVETFQHVLLSNNLKAKETLFIDDSVQHIEGAKNAGLQSYLLNPKEEDICGLF